MTGRLAFFQLSGSVFGMSPKRVISGPSNNKGFTVSASPNKILSERFGYWLTYMADKLCRKPDLVANDVVLLALAWLDMVYFSAEVRFL